MGSLALRPGDLLTILEMALSIGFRIFSFLSSCYSSYGALTFAPEGLSPTVHASLRWTHTFRSKSGETYLGTTSARHAVSRRTSAGKVPWTSRFSSTASLQLKNYCKPSVVRCQVEVSEMY